MQNPYPNMTIVTVPADSDGEDVSYHYIFGHECPHDALEVQLKAAVERWMRSEEAKEYATENWPATLDWVDVLANMSDPFFTDMGLARLDRECGDIRLNPDEDLVPEDVRQEIEALFYYGPEGEDSLQGDGEAT